MLRLAKLSFLLIILLLPLMKTRLAIGQLGAIPADAAFLLTAALSALALARGEVRLRWHPAFAGLAIYFITLLPALLVSPDVHRTALKLASQAYLLLLPVMAVHLVEDADDVRRACLAWLAASAALGAVAAATVLLFPVLGPNSILDGPLHYYGTLPPGPYPRLELSFTHPAMLANYLTVSLLILLAAARAGWLGQVPAALLGAGIVLAVLFALTPGFGGFAAASAVWGWLAWRERRRVAAQLLLGAAFGLVAAMVAVSAATPILHPTAPFLIHVAGRTLAPAVRLMAWLDALRSIGAAPLLGHGLGLDAVAVTYRNPSGEVALVTDAHNGFLNLAAQCGLIGVAGWFAALATPVRVVVRSAAHAAPRPGLETGLAIAVVSGFLVQGLVGSFEDARHLWIAFGLMLAAGQASGLTATPRTPPGSRGTCPA